MAYLNAEFVFKRRLGLLEVSTRQKNEFIHLMNVVTALDGAPAMRNAILEFIGKIKPEWSGCDIWYMNFEPWRVRWVIGIAHPSLPEVEPGSEPTRFELCMNTGAVQACDGPTL